MFRNFLVVYEYDWKWFCIYNKIIIDCFFLNILIVEGICFIFYRVGDEYKGV